MKKLAPSGFKLATQLLGAQHATAGLRRPPIYITIKRALMRVCQDCVLYFLQPDV